MEDPRSKPDFVRRLREALAPPSGGDVRQAIGRFLTRERDPRVILAEQEADGRPSIRATPDSPADRVLAMLPEGVERAARRVARSFDRGPVGAALQYVRESDPSQLVADAAGGPILAVGRRGAAAARTAREVAENADGIPWRAISERIAPESRRGIEIIQDATARQTWGKRYSENTPPSQFLSSFEGTKGGLSFNAVESPLSSVVPLDLPMDIASRSRRADELFPYETYHHTKAPEPSKLAFLEARRGRGEYKDIPSAHTGSIMAAVQRAWTEPQVLNLRFRAESPFLKRSGRVFREKELEDIVRNVKVTPEDIREWERALPEAEKFKSPHFREIDARQAVAQNKFRQFLIDEGYDIVPYRNQKENVGSISFMHLFPETDLRMRLAAFDPAKRDVADLMAGLALPALFTGGAVANQRKNRED